MFVIENVERLANNGNELNRRFPVKTQRVTFDLDASFARFAVALAMGACSFLITSDGCFAAEDSARNDAAGKYVSPSAVLAKSVCVFEKGPFPEPVTVSYELTDTEKRAIDVASSVLTDKMLKVDESTRSFINTLFGTHEMEVNGLFCELVRLELTQADRLNGVAWNGLVAFNVEAMRTRDRPSQAWGDWAPGGSMEKRSCFAVAQVRKVRGSLTVTWENFHYIKPEYIARLREVPASQQRSGAPASPLARQVRLRDIAGTPERSIAMINNLTFQKGEEGEVRVTDGKVRIRVLEINKEESSVVALIDGHEVLLTKRQEQMSDSPTDDPQIIQFYQQCGRLIQGLQQYKEFFKRYPAGTKAEIAKALSGQSDEKVVILSNKSSNRNDKGEIVDPWGTPIQFIFSHDTVTIRSAGPNRTFEDSTSAAADDLYWPDKK